MKVLGILFLLLTLSGQLPADDFDSSKWTTLYNKEKAGVRYYKKGKYKKAYEKLLFPAKVGLKEAQYYLGFMYLKGQHVQQSVGLGMAWLGVACETKIPEWQATFDQIYNAVTEEQRTAIDKNVSLYIKKYGVEEQEMDCTKESRVGSRKVTVSCMKTATARMQIDNKGK